MKRVPLSILELARIGENRDVRTTLDNARDLARHAERLGYRRIWVAEHHNFASIASAATSLVISHIAAGTEKIAVGSGGIMLPNHAPLVIAEQFGTLAHLYPGRIELGLGRAPGTDRPTMHALRRSLGGGDTFAQDVVELREYLGPARPDARVNAIPGVGTEVPLYILGSSTFGASLAADLGLPYAFASHFAPQQLLQALEIYRWRFKPSAQLARPHAIVGLNVIVADTDQEARRLWTTQQMSILDMFRGQRRPSRPPIDDIESLWTPAEREQIHQFLARSFVGSKATVREGLDAFVAETGADELIVVSDVYDHAARVRSLELLAEAWLEQ